MRAYERLLNYVKVYTTSDPVSDTHPTTARQFDLARMLVKELQALCLDITFSGLARTRFPATLSTSATMTSTVICTPSILFSQRKIALRP